MSVTYILTLNILRKTSKIYHRGKAAISTKSSAQFIEYCADWSLNLASSNGLFAQMMPNGAYW